MSEAVGQGSGRLGSGWFGSIRARIIASVVLLLLLSSIGSVLLLRTVLIDQLEDEITVDLRQEAEEFQLLSAGTDPETGEPFDDDLQAIFDVYFAREVPDEGESLLAFVDGRLYASRRAQDAADAEDLQPAIEEWLSFDERRQGSIGTALGEARYVAIPLDGRGPDGLFVVANFPAFERAEINDAVRTHIAVQLGTLVVASLLGLALAGRVLRPLRLLAGTARRISETDLSKRIPVTGRDEASQIADAFNAMLARLEDAFTTQRQFLDDTSHELRTPLTVIQGHLSLLELDDTAQARRQTVDLVMDEVDRMGSLVNSLFLLARAEHPGFLQVAPVDLRTVVADVQRKATVLAARDWKLEATGHVHVVADRNRLTQALLQLADNAVRFTAEGDAIRIGTDLYDGVARLWVDDAGTGVPVEDRERIFDRRGQGSSGHDGGAGLGLAIVATIAEGHGGRVALVAREGPGARFVITLPLTPTADLRRASPPA